MSASPEYTDYILEYLEPILPVRLARFFGGTGISHDGVQFAMIMHNTLYFAVNDVSRPNYVAAGMQAFSYQTKKGLIQVKKYYELPETVLVDEEQLPRWINDALAVAYATKKPKNPKHDSSNF